MAYPNVFSRAISGASAPFLTASDLEGNPSSLFIQADPANTQNIWIKPGTAAVSDGICLVPGSSITLGINRGKGNAGDWQAIVVSGTQRLNISLK